MSTEQKESATSFGGEVPPQTLEPGVKIFKEGGVQEIKHAEISTRQQTEYIEQLEREQENERIAMQRAKQAREEAEAHRKLEAEAEQLKRAKLEQSKQEAAEVERLAKEVENLKLQEAEIEKQRAEMHRKAVQTEEQRVKALSSKVLHEEEAREAAKIALQHQEGEKFSEALSKQHEYEVQEAQLRQRRLESMRETVIVGQPIPLTQEAAKIHVEVRPQPMPEQRAPSFDVPSGQRREAILEERLPEEFKQRAAEIDTRAGIEKRVETKVVEVKREESLSSGKAAESSSGSKQTSTKPASSESSATGVGAGDILGAIFDSLTGKSK